METYKYLHHDILTALDRNHLLSALQSLQGLATMLKAGGVKEEVDLLYDTYQSLLMYMGKGAADPGRDKMYAGFVRRAYELCNVLQRLQDLAVENGFYSTSYRSWQQFKGHEHLLSEILPTEVDGRNIFDAVWLSGMWSSGEETAVSDYMADDDNPVIHKCLVISGATLSALNYFDIAKYRLLLDYSLSSDFRLRTRALTGLVFIHILHARQVALYPDAEARLKLMADLPDFRREVELLQMQLFLSLETKRIEKSLQEEIIPRMMKRMKDLRLDRSTRLDEVRDQLLEADLNPEWEEDGSPSKLASYMKEFMELQKRGADMYMGQFKMLKQRFPFFRVPANWFWPFTMAHPELPAGISENRIVSMLLRADALCDSDKYSICLMSDQFVSQPLPPGMEESMNSAWKEMKEQDAFTTDADNEALEFKHEMRSYVQGFYRFCHLFMHRESFVNPFKHNLSIVDTAPFDTLLRHDDFLLRMAHFVFSDKSYEWALQLFLKLPTERLTAAIYQKMGYCHEQLGQADEACDCYEKANLLKPHSVWTLRRLAANYRTAGKYDKALTYYNELAGITPDDAFVSLCQADCLMHGSEYEKAFKLLFKADYLSPGTGTAERALAWCSLLTKKYGQAEHYYLKVLAAEPTETDYLNAGHSAWLSGNLPLAVERYVRSLKPGKEHADNRDFLNDDRDLLIKAGKSDNDLAMMTDLVLSRIMEA